MSDNNEGSPSPDGPTRPDAQRSDQTGPAPSGATTSSSESGSGGRRRRRRGSRGGRGRNRSGSGGSGGNDRRSDTTEQSDQTGGRDEPRRSEPSPSESTPRPRIGDSRPAPAPQGDGNDGGNRGGGGRPGGSGQAGGSRKGGKGRRRRRGSGSRSGGQGGGSRPVEAVAPDQPLDLDDEVLARRRGRSRKGRPVGRYLMCVHRGPQAIQVATLEGRSLIEHYVSRPTDDVAEIDGNVYLGRVQNVLPGMEAAFVDIGTPKNAVLYRGDLMFDPDDVEQADPRIEHLLQNGQTILCQVTKNPIGAKGARLTQEVSLPGRFVVLVPNSQTFGISKRLPDDARKRLRGILDRAKPAEHGVIVRTAAEHITAEELERDVRRLVDQWEQVDALAKRAKAPALLYREPDVAVRVIREELNPDFRGVIIDDRELFEEVSGYVAGVAPALADRVQYYDTESEELPLFERHHVHEQLHKALDRKVWLPSGGSLIIERTEALTVIDVNTGKNVGSKSLEETVFENNLEAAEEIARQLRLRDIGGIIVIDFIDMEVVENRKEVVDRFREALARDKTRTQVHEISPLGIVEMTRKRVGEGLVESLSVECPQCTGRGLILDHELIED